MGEWGTPWGGGTGVNFAKILVFIEMIKKMTKTFKNGVKDSPYNSLSNEPNQNTLGQILFEL